MAQISIPNPANAIRALEQWIKQDDTNPVLFSCLGQLALNAGDDILAEKVLLKAIKLHENQQDLIALAEIRERKQDATGALAMYKRSMEVSQNALV